MKIKFEVKAPNTAYALYTILGENKNEDVEFLISKFNLRNMRLNETNSMEKQEIPIDDGIMRMDRAHLKKFIEALKCLLKG